MTMVRNSILARLARIGAGAATSFLLVSALGAHDASAQTTVPPLRDKAWKNVTGVAVIVGGATQLLMPRVFYPEPEVTVGWKARWHLSVLAPVMTITTLALINEYQLKDTIKGYRPNCDDTNQGMVAGCYDYGAPSTHTFAAFSALGHGLGVFMVDTFKWNDGRVNAFSVIGNIGVPLISSVLTFVGRGVGNWEKPGQNLSGGLLGLGTGLVLGTLYAELQRPECGYSGSLICW
ncbi:MAG: hypothetical protein NVSMB47_12630 [Polyangiales bacterium]